jgi:hypothetical protein
MRKLTTSGAGKYKYDGIAVDDDTTTGELLVNI